MAQRRQAKREVEELLPRLRAGLGVADQLREEEIAQFTTEEFDQAFRLVDDAVQLFGRMHKIEQPTLRQFRNMQRSAIYRIPLETLGFIFISAAGVEDHPLEEKDALGRCHIRRAMAISHVCNRWYNVAVPLSALWAVFDLDVSRRLTGMALERSGTRPLTILGSHSRTDGPNKSLHCLSLQIHRWRAAHITITESRLHRIMRSPAPLLRDLRITSPADDDASDISDAQKVFSAQQFFQGHTPSLEKLDIAYWVRCGTPNLPSLRELRIGYWGLVSPTVSEIVAMLAGCSRLEELELGVCLLALDLLGPQPFPQAELPQLRQLILIGSHPVHTAAILNHLQCPRLELANIDFRHPVLDPEQVSPMRNHLLQAIKPKFQSMLHGTNQLRLVLGRSEVGFRMERSSSPEPISINFLEFGFRPVLEWVLEEFPEVTERCTTVIIYPQTESPPDPATSSYGAVRDLIASLRSVEGLIASRHPEICQIFQDFLRPRDLQSESSHPLIRNIILDGCICPWKENIVQTLQETESRQGKVPTRPRITISASTYADCEECPATRDLLRPFVDYICFPTPSGH